MEKETEKGSSSEENILADSTLKCSSDTGESLFERPLELRENSPMSISTSSDEESSDENSIEFLGIDICAGDGSENMKACDDSRPSRRDAKIFDSEADESECSKKNSSGHKQVQVGADESEYRELNPTLLRSVLQQELQSRSSTDETFLTRRRRRIPSRIPRHPSSTSEGTGHCQPKVNKKSKLEINLNKFNAIMRACRGESLELEDNQTDTNVRRTRSFDELNRTFDGTSNVNEMARDFQVTLKISSKSAPPTLAGYEPKATSDAPTVASEGTFKIPEIVVGELKSKPRADKANSTERKCKGKDRSKSDSMECDENANTGVSISLVSVNDLSSIGSYPLIDLARTVERTTRTTEFDSISPATPRTPGRTSPGADIPCSSVLGSRRPKSLEIPSLRQDNVPNCAPERATPSSVPAKRPNRFSFVRRKNFYMFHPNKHGILKRSTSAVDLVAFRKKHQRRRPNILLPRDDGRSQDQGFAATSGTDDSDAGPSNPLHESSVNKEATCSPRTPNSEINEFSERTSKSDPVGRWGPLQRNSRRSPTGISMVPSKKVSRKLFCPERLSNLTKMLQGSMPYRPQRNIDDLGLRERIPPSVNDLKQISAAPPNEGAERETSVPPKRSGDSRSLVLPSDSKAETEKKRARLSLEERKESLLPKETPFNRPQKAENVQTTSHTSSSRQQLGISEKTSISSMKHSASRKPPNRGTRTSTRFRKKLDFGTRDATTAEGIAVGETSTKQDVELPDDGHNAAQRLNMPEENVNSDGCKSLSPEKRTNSTERRSRDFSKRLKKSKKKKDKVDE